MKSQNLKGDATYLWEMNKNAKMKAKTCNGLLGAAGFKSFRKP